MKVYNRDNLGWHSRQRRMHSNIVSWYLIPYFIVCIMGIISIMTVTLLILGDSLDLLLFRQSLILACIV